ncbi:hypothetical protein Kpho02_29390 [Kitasatospora phosalacinea]|uniref:Uncharacterized protein n=1 Tax=Kitasatospora phosalacinea TaxID=2065 RepID=A0A9W6V327_9ACTN|nr:hypothetical protein [Kitasatospora phosalacinea]GLW70640.1 hypothetical protein Kpho02_29390 [Kitasatospora phosalacinea]
MTAPTSPDGTPPYPSAPPAAAAPAPPRRIDLQGWSAVVTALVGVATLGAGFAGGYLTQSQGSPGGRPQPTVTVTVPGPTVTATVPAAAGAAAAPTLNTLPSQPPSSPKASTARVLLASPDSGRGGSRTVVTGQGFPPDTVVRISFVIKALGGGEYAHRDLRDTKTDAAGAFSVEVSVPSDLDHYTEQNAYLRAQVGTEGTPTETVFDLLP